MALSPNKTDAKKLREVLDPDWKKLKKPQLAELDAICLEVLERAFKVYEEKSKFIVVGQLYYTQRDGTLKSWDPAVERVALGPFPSEATARTGVQQLGKFPTQGSSYAGADTFLTWVLPYWNGTGADWHKARKAQLDKENAPAEKRGALDAEQERLAAVGRCGLEVMDEDLNWVPCFRPVDHPGACFPKPPEQGEDLAVTYMNEDAGRDRPIALRGSALWPADKEAP